GDRGLERYYELRNGRGVPARESEAARSDDKWLDVAALSLTSVAGLRLVPLDVEGIHCSGCVWLIDELFRRTGATGSVRTNPSTGALDLFVDESFDLRRFVGDIEAVGYRVGPRREAGETSSSLLLRLGITVALAMNAMIFSIAIYAGLDEGQLHTAFHLFTFGLALIALGVGGSVFIVAAARGLARGLLHLDLPIALGLVLGFAGSTWSLVASGGKDAYFDTLTIFIALMLAGRFLRERVIEKNRTQLVADAGPLDLLVRRIVPSDAGRKLEITSVAELRPGDRLLVAPGDVVPVDATLASASAALSLDWITGESALVAARESDLVRAGAANAGNEAIEATALTGYAASPLSDLLRAPRPADRYGEALAPFEAMLARRWAIGVLVVSALVFLTWTAATGDVARAVGVTVGVLVVTCPCAFGIATPLAHEVVLGALRRAGLLVRSTTFLERATSIRRVVFDKTGTLTTGRITGDAAALSALSPDEARIFKNLADRSSHPKSAALRAALPASADGYLELVAHEIPNKGIETTVAGVTYRLGDPRWIAPNDARRGDVALAADDRVLALLSTDEELRPDARREVSALREAGIDVWMVTGDRRDRAETVAAQVGVDPSHVLAERTPEQKADEVRRLDHGDTLYVGDGINDALAVRVATCSGTPAAGRAFLAARTDFYLLGEGLAPLRLALRGARALRGATARNLRVSLAYNVVVVGLAWAGLMTPLLAAIAMPLSSILSITLVVRALAPKEAAWRS
ncbi:MAG TPA: heavy metal translocating P-type ATPase, partial [Polyangiaceae bacterium]|nr:heavy metal translocating P-type ATPase [Polyangiaceae bacterium]